MLAASRAKRVLSAQCGAASSRCGYSVWVQPVQGLAAGMASWGVVSAGGAGKGCPACSGLGLLMDERLWR